MDFSFKTWRYTSKTCEAFPWIVDTALSLAHTPTWYFFFFFLMQARNPLGILHFSRSWCERRLREPTPRDADSHRCSRTYSNIFCPSVREEGRRRGEAERTRGDYELNVDLSSAGCRSKEQHWQAEHRIHQSLRSMPSSSFSEVDEHTGAWL